VTVVVDSGPRTLWLSTLDTVLETDRMPPGAIDAATATTVKKTTAVKTTPGRPPLGTSRAALRCSLIAHRACTARGVGPTKEDDPFRTIHAIAAKSSSCFSVVTVSAWSNARRWPIHRVALPVLA
jgi:hypothetical protein